MAVRRDNVISITLRQVLNSYTNTKCWGVTCYGIIIVIIIIINFIIIIIIIIIIRFAVFFLLSEDNLCFFLMFT